jgi:chemotaxis protein MotB
MSKPPAANERRHETIIVKKIIQANHGGHHGGAWKVAYADFVTAMMAFFLLLWIVGATDEDQRKGIADYFAPTLVNHSKSGGSNGILQGRSIMAPDGNAAFAKPPAVEKIAPIATSGAYGNEATKRSGGTESAQRDQIAREQQRASAAAFALVESNIRQALVKDVQLKNLEKQISFVQSPEGLRIEIMDRTGFSMFDFGTDTIQPDARKLIRLVARSMADLPNPVAIRGHTDAYAYTSKNAMNNWLLSAQRADQTRAILADAGIADVRLSRIEGVADRELMIRENPLDPRNRRISITLLYR